MKIKNILLLSVLLTNLFLVGCGTNTEKDEEKDSIEKITGTTLIEKSGCSTIVCHGIKLNGVGGNGVNLRNQDSTKLIEALEGRRDGKEGTLTMQNIAKDLTDEDIKTLALYLQNLSADSNTSEVNQTQEAIKDFKDYASNEKKWKKIDTLFGANPSIDPILTTSHGTDKFFRTIYKSPINASNGENGYLDGTIFVLNLKVDNDGIEGELTEITTVMKKENGQWTFIELSPTLNQIKSMGTQEETTEIGNIAQCIGCHSGANQKDDYTFATSKPIKDKDSNLSNFKDYEKWSLSANVRDDDLAGLILNEHGNSENLFRRIYKKQLTPKVNGQYPIGTTFLIELRKEKDGNRTAEDIDQNITIMVKREANSPKNNNWEYIVTDGKLNKIITQGQNGEAVQSCINCHTQAQKITPNETDNDYIFPLFSKDDENSTKKENGEVLYNKIGCSICHGNNAEGVSAPQLNNQETKTLIKKLKDRKAKKLGGNTMQNIASKLSDKDIENIALYISSVGN